MKTMKLHPDFNAFLCCLLDRGVKFLIVGSYALAVLGRARVTDDLDLLVEPTKANARRLAAALADFGYDELAAVATAHFSAEERMATLGRPPVAIDILTSVTGVRFGDAWKNRVLVSIVGRDVPFIGKAAFVATKRACGRPKDLADLALLAEVDDLRPATTPLKRKR